jgi:hypothetical protein
MAGLLVERLRAADAPLGQYERLGLPAIGPVTDQHLLVRAQQAQAEASRQPPPRPGDFPTGPFSVHVPLRELLAHPGAAAVLREHFATLLDGPFARMAADLSLLQIAAFAVGLLPAARLQAIAAELSAAEATTGSTHHGR